MRSQSLLTVSLRDSHTVPQRDRNYGALGERTWGSSGSPYDPCGVKGRTAAPSVRGGRSGVTKNHRFDFSDPSPLTPVAVLCGHCVCVRYLSQRRPPKRRAPSLAALEKRTGQSTGAVPVDCSPLFVGPGGRRNAGSVDAASVRRLDPAWCDTDHFSCGACPYLSTDGLVGGCG